MMTQIFRFLLFIYDTQVELLDPGYRLDPALLSLHICVGLHTTCLYLSIFCHSKKNTQGCTMSK